MDRDRGTSKGEGKSASPPVRKGAATYLSSNARAVIGLQQAAGNRAVAKMFTPSASGVSAQRTELDASKVEPRSPVVQRHELDAALKDEAQKKGTAMPDISAIAATLLEGGTGKASGAGTEKTAKVVETPQQRAKDLAEIERRKKLTPDQLKKEDEEKAAKLDKEEGEDDEIALVKAKEKRDKDTRSSLRAAARLNPEHKSVSELLGKRKF